LNEGGQVCDQRASTQLRGQSAHLIAEKRQAFALDGVQGVLKHTLKRLLQDPNPNYSLVAIAYAQLGDKDKAFEYINKGIDTHEFDPRLWLYDPAVGGSKADPRFQTVLKRVNFPQT